MKRVIALGIAVVAVATAPAFAQGKDPLTKPQPGTTTKQETPAQRTTDRAIGADQQFLVDMATGNMAEVALGQLAVTQGSNAEVKTFAQKMVDDHGKALTEVEALAKSKNVTLPSEVDARQKATRDRLAKLSGAQFDRAYGQQMVQDHRAKANKVRAATKTLKDPEVKAFAAKTLPTVEEHLKLAQSLNAKPVGTAGSKPPATNKPEGTTKPPATNKPEGTTKPPASQKPPDIKF